MIELRKKSNLSTQVKNTAGVAFVWLSRWFAGRKPNSSTDQTILCIATTGLGDSLMITPAIRELKRAIPSARIHLLVTDSSYQVFRGSKYVDEFYFFRKGRGLFKLFEQLLSVQFTTALIFHASDRLVWFLGAAVSPRVIAGDWQPVMIPRHIVDIWYPTPDREHRIHSHLKMCRCISLAVDIESTSMEYEPLVADNAAIDSLLGVERNRANDEKTIAFFPGAKDRFKCWPIARFIALGKTLQALGMRLVLVGSDHDDDLLSALERSLEQPAVLKGSLEDLASVLKSVDCFVTNDSGPMHLAAALGTPVVSLFAPTDDHETGVLDSFSRSLTIKKPVTCFPSKAFSITPDQCFNKRCSNPICMKQISVQEVLTKLMIGISHGTD